MRCSKCGWPNKPSETNCTKCGAPLVKNDDDYNMAPASGGAPADNAQQPDIKSTIGNFSKTIIGEPPAATDAPAPSTPVQSAPATSAASPMTYDAELPQRCPKCGYPLSHDSSVCPNCKSVLHKPAVPASEPRATQSHDDAMPHGTKPADNQPPHDTPLGGTVNPYLQMHNLEPEFKLQPVRRYNEPTEPQRKEYEGEEVVLTRDNTDADNTSITSHEQAVVTNADGKWFIEDRSSQGTTFVQARHKIELHDGDTILLGNRLFIFHE